VLRVSVDIGGTFTDMVITAPDGTVEMFKSPSTYGALSDGVLNCLRKAAKARLVGLDALLGDVETIIHGTTATTNALLTRSGVKTGMLTTKGFRDIIELRLTISKLSSRSRWSPARAASASTSASAQPARSSPRSTRARSRRR